MNDYLVVKLKNDQEFVIIDKIQYNKKIYFLVLKNLELKNNSDDNFEIYEYKEEQNYLNKIKNIEEYNLIFSIFDSRMEKQVEIITMLEKLYKMRIVHIDNYDYTLESEKGSRLIKNIHFETNIKPKINDYIYMGEKIINEVNIFVYGEVNNLSKLTEDEIIKLEGQDYEYYLQRYYG